MAGNLADSQSLPVTGNTDRTQPENRAFYPALDGLRAIAFLMVFFWHYDALPWGWAGVNIFFVLSGFLITGILFDTRNDRHRVRNFYVRRALRIFPLYYGVLFGLVLLYPYAHWRWTWHWLVWPAFLGNFAAYVHPYLSNSTTGRLVDFQLVSARPGIVSQLNLGHFWTLCVEEQFYFVWPWLVFAVRDRRTLLWICAASVPLCLAARLLGSNLLPGWMLEHDVLAHATPFRVDDLLLGGLLALLLRGPLAQGLLRWSRVAVPIAISALLIWLLVTPAHRLAAVPYPYPRSVLTWGFTDISVLTALVLLVAIQPGTVLYRALGIYPLRWMGRISYGAYVFHDVPHVLYARIAFHFVRLFVPSTGFFGRLVWAHIDLGTSLLALFATFLIAWLSFRFYESRFLKLKARWTVH